MKKLSVVFLLLLAAMLLSGSAQAAPTGYNFGRALRIMSGSFTVPPEWDGIWSTQDSTYDCTTGPTGTSSGLDTLCAGQVFDENSPDGSLTFTCTGTADATTVHATCSGSSTVLPDCQAIFDIQIDVIRSSESYRSVSTTTVTYSGTGTGCSLLPGSCTRIVTYGTRTGPAPSVYCLTPVKGTTWGRLKMLYR